MDTSAPNLSCVSPDATGSTDTDKPRSRGAVSVGEGRGGCADKDRARVAPGVCGAAVEDSRPPSPLVPSPVALGSFGDSWSPAIPTRRTGVDPLLPMVPAHQARSCSVAPHTDAHTWRHTHGRTSCAILHGACQELGLQQRDWQRELAFPRASRRVLAESQTPQAITPAELRQRTLPHDNCVSYRGMLRRGPMKPRKPRVQHECCAAVCTEERAYAE